MQGTIVMLMALSGLGCHHRGAAPAYGAGCYSGNDSCYGGCYSTSLYASCYSGCYASYYGAGGSCYGGCYSSSYGSCYSSCYGGGCYGGRKHGGLFGGGGLFGCHKNRGGCYGGVGYGSGGCYGSGWNYSGCYAYDMAPAYDCYSGCSPAVFGSYTPVGPVYTTGQTWASSQGMPTGYGQPIPGSQGVISTNRVTAIPTPSAPGGVPAVAGPGRPGRGDPGRPDPGRRRARPVTTPPVPGVPAGRRRCRASRPRSRAPGRGPGPGTTLARRLRRPAIDRSQVGPLPRLPGGGPRRFETTRSRRRVPFRSPSDL